MHTSPSNIHVTLDTRESSLVQKMSSISAPCSISTARLRRPSDATIGGSGAMQDSGSLFGVGRVDKVWWSFKNKWKDHSLFTGQALILPRQGKAIKCQTYTILNTPDGSKACLRLSVCFTPMQGGIDIRRLIYSHFTTRRQLLRRNDPPLFASYLLS